MHTEADWNALKAAEDDTIKIAAARELAQDDTRHIVRQLADSLGAFQGSDAEAYLGVAIAKSRPNGMQWLAEHVYGAPLDEVFADCLSHDATSNGRLDWGALADALMIGVSDDPEADRWLALMAIAEDGDSTTRVRTAISADPSVRLRIREALSRQDMPRELPGAMLIAFGAPRDDAEATWLASRYQAALAAAIEDRPIDDNAAFDELNDGWHEAFANRSLPLSPRDREIMRVLKPLLAPDDAPDVPPSFAEIASFMTRHNRSGWARMVEIYAEGNALPTNALSFVCRVSTAECSEVLAGGYVKEIASAADVAPALDLDGGEATLGLACSQLPPGEARQLAGRAAGAGMPLRMREAAASCLMSLGDDMTATWNALLPEAIRSKDWENAETIAAVAAGTVDDTTRSQVMDLVSQGEVRAIDVPWLLVGSDTGAALLRDGILAQDPTALDGLSPEMAGAYLAPVAEHLRAPVRVIRMDAVPID